MAVLLPFFPLSGSVGEAEGAVPVPDAEGVTEGIPGPIEEALGVPELTGPVGSAGPPELG